MPFLFEPDVAFDVGLRAETIWTTLNKAPGKTLRFVKDAIANRTRLGVTSEAVLSCRPGEWLNSTAIITFGRLLESQSKQYRIFVCDTQFYRSGMPGSLKSGYDIEVLCERFLPCKLPGMGLLAYDCIAVPVWHPHGHWSLGICDLFSETCQFFDSGDKDPTATAEEFAADMTTFFKLYTAHCGIPIRPPRIHAWKITVNYDPISRKAFPQQADGCSCGMFMLCALECRAKNRAMLFSTADMNAMRARLALLLANGE